MGKIKTVVMGDIAAEEKAREKAEAKRAQKSALGRSAAGGKAEKGKTEQEEEEKKEKEQLQEETSVPEEPKKPESQKTRKSEEPPKSGFSETPISRPSESSDKSEKKPKAKKVDGCYLFSAGKKYLAVRALVDPKKTYSDSEAIALVKKTSYSSFDGAVEVHLNVTDKNLRGSVVLPHGTGKEVRVKIADDALITDLEKSGKIDFDILVAEPSMMPKLAKVAKILGPRGLMPNPKTNTIGENPIQLAKILSSSISWKTQPDFPIIHSIIGKVSFENKELEENLAALLKSVGKDKIKSVFLKATMGPSIKIQV